MLRTVEVLIDRLMFFGLLSVVDDTKEFLAGKKKADAKDFDSKVAVLRRRLKEATHNDDDRRLNTVIRLTYVVG